MPGLAWDECKKGLVELPQPQSTLSQVQRAPGATPTITDRITPSLLISEPSPPYTDEARKAGIEGSVKLWIKIDDAGKVSYARATEGLGYGLDEQAVKTVKEWKFKPALENGRPVPVSVEVIAAFRLRH